MSLWSKIKNFCRVNWKYLVYIISLLGIFILGNFFYKRFKSSGKSLLIKQFQYELAKNENEISFLEGKRSVIKEQEGEVTDEIEYLDGRINSLKASMDSKKKEINRLTAEEKLEEFKRLGY